LAFCGKNRTALGLVGTVAVAGLGAYLVRVQGKNANEQSAAAGTTRSALAVVDWRKFSSVPLRTFARSPYFHPGA